MNIHKILSESVRKVLSEANEAFEQKAAQYRKRGIELTKPIFGKVCKADPTSNGENAGKYFDWIYKNKEQIDGLSFNSAEHWSMLPQLLQLYNNNIKNIPIENRNIMNMDYFQFSDMLGASAVGQKSYQTGVKQWEGQFDIVAKTDKWIGVHCKTWECEKFFGQGAQWCTVGSNHYYKQYNSSDKLIICIPIENGMPNIRSKRRWQCDISRRSFHCADITDRTFNTMRDFFEKYPDAYDENFVNQLRELDKRFYPMDGDEFTDDDQNDGLLMAGVEELDVDPNSVFVNEHGTYITLDPDDPCEFFIYQEAVAYEDAREHCHDTMDWEWINEANIFNYLDENKMESEFQKIIIAAFVDEFSEFGLSVETAKAILENERNIDFYIPEEEELAQNGIDPQTWTDERFGMSIELLQELNDYGQRFIDAYIEAQNGDFQNAASDISMSCSQVYNLAYECDGVDWDAVAEANFDNIYNDPIEEWLGYGYGTYYFTYEDERYVLIHGDRISTRSWDEEEPSRYDRLCQQFHYTPDRQPRR